MERWVCPFCNFSQIIDDNSKQVNYTTVDLNGGLPFQTAYKTVAYACTNPDCRKISLTFHLYGFIPRMGERRQEEYASLSILPRSNCRPQPEYIPFALRQDYEEACAIRELSPKASATLVRRCLQGMIRDFCGITDQRTLFDEIQKLKVLMDEGRAPKGVTDESVEAIDRVRGVGNIGAHMEKDIDLIVDVDPDEAQILIGLVEMLFEEWYVARHQRENRLAQIREISKAKEDAKNGQLLAASPEGGAA